MAEDHGDESIEEFFRLLRRSEGFIRQYGRRPKNNKDNVEEQQELYNRLAKGLLELEKFVSSHPNSATTFGTSSENPQGNIVLDTTSNADQIPGINNDADLASLKSHFCKDYGLNPLQIDNTLAFTPEEYEKYQNVRDDIDNKISDLLENDPLSARDICAQKSMEERILKDNIINGQESISPEVLDKVKANAGDKTQEQLRDEMYKEQFKMTKEETLGKLELTKISAVPENLKDVPTNEIKFGAMTFNVDKELELSMNEKSHILEIGDREFPGSEITDISVLKKSDTERVVDFNSNGKNLGTFNERINQQQMQNNQATQKQQQNRQQQKQREQQRNQQKVNKQRSSADRVKNRNKQVSKSTQKKTKQPSTKGKSQKPPVRKSPVK